MINKCNICHTNILKCTICNKKINKNEEYRCVRQQDTYSHIHTRCAIINKLNYHKKYNKQINKNYNIVSLLNNVINQLFTAEKLLAEIYNDLNIFNIRKFKNKINKYFENQKE